MNRPVPDSRVQKRAGFFCAFLVLGVLAGFPGDSSAVRTKETDQGCYRFRKKDGRPSVGFLRPRPWRGPVRTPSPEDSASSSSGIERGSPTLSIPSFFSASSQSGNVPQKSSPGTGTNPEEANTPPKRRMIRKRPHGPSFHPPSEEESDNESPGSGSPLSRP